MCDDEERIQVVHTELAISDDDLLEIIKAAKSENIPVREWEYKFFERKEVEIGDYSISKWDLTKDVWDRFDINHSQHEWHPEPEISVDDVVIKLIAKYAKDGTYIEFVDYQGNMFRWVFKDGEVTEKRPVVTYDWS